MQNQNQIDYGHYLAAIDSENKRCRIGQPSPASWWDNLHRASQISHLLWLNYDLTLIKN
jgi:hypothetical protein